MSGISQTYLRHIPGISEYLRYISYVTKAYLISICISGICLKNLRHIWHVLPRHNIFLLLLICKHCHFLSCNKNFLYIYFGCCHTQISNLRALINFENMLRIIRKLGQPLNLPDFWVIFNIFAKLNDKNDSDCKISKEYSTLYQES